MSVIDPGCALCGEDEPRGTPGPKAWPSIPFHSIRHTKRLGLPGRVREREAPREAQQGFPNECLATTVQAGIFAWLTLSAIFPAAYPTVFRNIAQLRSRSIEHKMKQNKPGCGLL